ncbi:protein SSUH2 homolog isoform X1 [Hyla sarda]|uniref:protein SSUH2 homolog isoform X1 n=2 Tax=Hyla sarda TaxID=327740 RepID=UPI0024C34EA2|nr:protein SSUH2 homolog isoform X1 [Hyla sarda]
MISTVQAFNRCKHPRTVATVITHEPEEDRGRRRGLRYWRHLGSGERTMEMPDYGQAAPLLHSGYPMNPAMPPGPPYPVAMNPAVAPGYYPSVNTHAPQMAPYPQFSGVPGYEGLDGTDNGGKYLPPPPAFGAEPGHLPVPTSKDWLIPSINNETAKHALLDYANSKCCYGSSPAEEMEITQLRPYNTYRYRLETFTESRSCEWVTKPLTEGVLDSPEKGPAPQPWEIHVKTPSLFHDETQKVPVPHTTSKKSCQECNGKGKIICQKCNGNSRERCEHCSGSGKRLEEECEHCDGTGNIGCKTCNQTNVQTCPGCSGKGQVMTYIEMTVTWKNNVFEFIPDHHSEFPTDLFKKVTGEKMYSDEQLLVPPIINFPEPSINQTSQTAVQQHYSQFMSSSRILMQRQTIELLPLTKVEYSWKGKNCNYFVYGRENKVETKDYPSTCCCVIL